MQLNANSIANTISTLNSSTITGTHTLTIVTATTIKAKKPLELQTVSESYNWSHMLSMQKINQPKLFKLIQKGVLVGIPAIV